MASRDTNAYFIITANLPNLSRISPGSICYIKEKHYSTLKLQKKDTVRVVCIGNPVDYNVPDDTLHPLTRQQSEFLLALESFKDRLKVVAQPEALDQAVEINEGSDVIVEQNSEWLKGVVRYIGPLSEPSLLDPIAAVFFGVELQGEDEGKGQNDGMFGYKRHFKCQKGCGVFVPFTRIKLLHPKSPASWAGIQDNLTLKLCVGDRITYILDDKSVCQHGMVLNPVKDGMILISTDVDEHGKAGGEREIPWHCVIKEDDVNTDEWQKCM